MEIISRLIIDSQPNSSNSRYTQQRSPEKVLVLVVMWEWVTFYGVDTETPSAHKYSYLFFLDKIII